MTGVLKELFEIVVDEGGKRLVKWTPEMLKRIKEIVKLKNSDLAFNTKKTILKEEKIKLLNDVFSSRASRDPEVVIQTQNIFSANDITKPKQVNKLIVDEPRILTSGKVEVKNVDPVAKENFKAASVEAGNIISSEKRKGRYFLSKEAQKKRIATKFATSFYKQLPYWKKLNDIVETEGIGIEKAVLVHPDTRAGTKVSNKLGYAPDQGWGLYGKYMLNHSDPKIAALARKIQNHIDFYKRNSIILNAAKPSEKSYIKTLEALEDISASGVFKHRPDALGTKLAVEKQPFDFPIEGDHVMDRVVKSRIEEAGDLDLIKHGGFKESGYITTAPRNKFKQAMTDKIQYNILKKAEALQGMNVNNREKVLADIAQHDAHIFKIAGELEDMGLETAVWDPFTKKVKYYGKTYDNYLQLKQSVEEGVVPMETGYFGPNRPMPEKVIKKDGVDVVTRKYQDGGLVSIEEVIGYNHG